MALHILMEPKYEAYGQRNYWGIMPGGKYICSFDCDELFNIFYPLYEEVQRETGKLIDEYGWACLCGEELEAVVRMIQKVQSVVEEKSDSWAIEGWTSIQGQPYANRMVSKKEVQGVLKQMLAVTEESIKDQTCITFQGD